MRKIQNLDQYLDVIHQAIFETEELMQCAEDEGEGDAEFTGMLPQLQQIDAGLKALHAEILGGGYAIGRGQDLPFMAVVNANRRRLPIVGLIDAVNNAHKKGFEA
jgi:hypothetical protein